MFNRRYELTLVVLLFVAWGFVFLDRMALPFLSPYIKPDLRLSDSQIGNLNAVLALGWAASTFLLGALSDRVGRKPVLVPSLMLVALLTVASGMAQDYDTLLVTRGLLGIAEGPIWATMAALISESSSEKTRGTNLAIVLSAGTIIGLVIGPILVTQIASNYSWHSAFYIAGLPVFIVGILIWRLVKNPQVDKSHHLHHAKPTMKDFHQILKTPNIWLCSLAASAFMSWLYLFNAFGPLYMAEVKGLDPRVAGMVMGTSGMGGVVLGFLMVWLAGRFGRKPAALIMSILAILSPLLLMVDFLYQPVSLLAGLGFLTNCSVGITTLVLVVAAAESVPHNTAAAAIGMVSMFGEIVGATVMPAIGGALATQYGLQAPLLLGAGSAAVMALAISMLSFYRVGDIAQTNQTRGFEKYV
nr:MFS transporter [uncultured Rhodoferax sp.]